MEEDVQKALNRSYQYLTHRQRTTHEVRVYLQKKSDKFYHWAPGVIEKAIERLIELKYLDDASFVDAYVRSRTQLKPKSERMLRLELSRLGIENQLLDEYFGDNPIVNEELAVKALSSKWNQYRSLEPRKRYEKAIAFLIRRGFSYDVAKKAVAAIEETE